VPLLLRMPVRVACELNGQARQRRHHHQLKHDLRQTESNGACLRHRSCLCPPGLPLQSRVCGPRRFMTRLGQRAARSICSVPSCAWRRGGGWKSLKSVSSFLLLTAYFTSQEAGASCWSSLRQMFFPPSRIKICPCFGFFVAAWLLDSQNGVFQTVGDAARPALLPFAHATPVQNLPPWASSCCLLIVAPSLVWFCGPENPARRLSHLQVPSQHLQQWPDLS